MKLHKDIPKTKPASMGLEEGFVVEERPIGH
jgi:hypothetical protein